MEPKTTKTLQQVDDVTVVDNQDLVDLLLLLLKERGIISSHSYQYEGFWYCPLSLQGIGNLQKYFQPRQNDIVLVTSLKSGTIWSKAIIYSLINREVHSLKILTILC